MTVMNDKLIEYLLVCCLIPHSVGIKAYYFNIIIPIDDCFQVTLSTVNS